MRLSKIQMVQPQFTKSPLSGLGLQFKKAIVSAVRT